jgi:hypothetical protein
VSFANEAVRLRALGFHPIPERPNQKLPVESAWQTRINRTPDELRAAFAAAPEGHGIGTITHEFIVVDLDLREDVDGIAALGELPPLPPTLASHTPSGGMHLFLRVPQGVEVRNSVSKVGRGIDVRGKGGQVVLPPTVIDGKAYRWSEGCPAEMAMLPEPWLALVVAPKAAPAPAPAAPEAPAMRRVIRPEAVAAEADRRAKYMDTLDRPSIQGSGGNAVMMQAAFHAKEMSRTEDEAVEALLGWNERLATPPWSEAELRRAVRNSDAVYGAGLDREGRTRGRPEARS